MKRLVLTLYEYSVDNCKAVTNDEVPLGTEYPASSGCCMVQKWGDGLEAELSYFKYEEELAGRILFSAH